MGIWPTFGWKISLAPRWPSTPVGMCALQGACVPPGWETPAGNLSLQPEALGAVQEVTKGLKHSEKRISLEIQRAAPLSANDGETPPPGGNYSRAVEGNDPWREARMGWS